MPEKRPPLLVPTDFGEPAEAALALALGLAPKLDADVVLLHAYEIPPYTYPGAPLIPIVDVAPSVAKAAQAGLDAAVLGAQRTWPRVSGVLRQGKPWREIVDHAAEIAPQIIIMGTHGRSGLERALLGSVAAKVVRATTAPVLTVHE
jgi:nucleotide-binding universal stress UspA family protein